MKTLFLTLTLSLSSIFSFCQIDDIVDTLRIYDENDVLLSEHIYNQDYQGNPNQYNVFTIDTTFLYIDRNNILDPNLNLNYPLINTYKYKLFYNDYWGEGVYVKRIIELSISNVMYEEGINEDGFWYQNNDIFVLELGSYHTFWRFKFKKDNSVSTDNIEVNSLCIYPNPVNDYLNISINGTEKVVLTDLNGSIIFDDIIYSEGKIDLLNESNGIYILQIGNQFQKIVKQ